MGIKRGIMMCSNRVFVWVFAIVLVLDLPAHSQNLKYPPDFLWGAAFSAHQTEGKTGGAENGDWWHFEHPQNGQSPIANGDTADISIDHWNRYPEDFAAAKDIGLNTVRTSLAWEKIEPKPGVFNEEVIGHYRDVLKSMRDHGLRPMIALNHFTHPLWFQEQGGWLSPQSPQHFARYAQYVATHLSDLCDLWITFNEPMILVQMSYVKGVTPPLKTGLQNGFEAAYNTARAHRLAVHALHSAKSTNSVGVAYAFQIFDPVDENNKDDVRAANELSEISNWDWLRGVETGHMEFRYTKPGLLWSSQEVYKRDLPPNEMAVPSKIDWLGVNFYNRFLIRSRGSSLPFEWQNPPGPQSDMGWVIVPLELERMTRLVAKHHSYPLLITECGLADSADTKRPDFIRRNLYALDRLIKGSEQGGPIDVRGYYHWSLMDNFEWLHGYKYRFGLVEVQYGNGLKRVPRYSASVYSEEIKKRSN
jgi:beta-glucosidase